MRIVIGSDLAGFSLKEEIKQRLEEAGYEVSDVGTHEPESPVMYMVVGDRVAKAIQAGEAERGLLFCGTGMGVSITANKHKGVYCALVESDWAAHECRRINDANVLAMGGRIVAPAMAWDMVRTFLSTGFCEGNSEAERERLSGLLSQLKDLEEELF